MVDSGEINFKEKRIKDITFIYYSIPEVKKALLSFSQNRECVPRYFEGFGKRPDSFQYESDITEFVKKGATSFHCSEEIWEDPLEISTSLKSNELNELRAGWDMLLDIDSKYLEYSKIYADLIVKTLEFYGVKSIGVKFSGSKGMHIIIPWKAFPKEVYGQKTKNMFPEWPRIICEFLSEAVQPKLADSIFENQSLKELAKRTGNKEEELLITECLNCHRPAVKKELVTWVCPHCKNELVMIKKNKRIPKCPNDDCRKIMIEKSSKEIYSCEFCNENSQKNPENFAKTRPKTEKLIEADLVLVSSRHLFRMPYSLHEKTALASIVIDKDKIKDFQITDANPFKLKIKDYYPDAKEGEAKNLLLQALDWKEQKQKIEKKPVKSPEEYTYAKTRNSDIKIKVTPDLYPPCIKSLMNGVKQDGRKRALFLLMNFFKSLKLSDEEIEAIINSWNEKNYSPLKQGYVQSQFSWYKRSSGMMPPNCDKPNYKDLNICKPDEICRQIKNPVNYVYKKYFRNRG